jgi:hypothetical protein
MSESDSLPGRESSQHFTPVIALAWGDCWINFGFFSRFRSTKWPGSENPVRSLRKVSGRKYKMRMEHQSVAGALDGLFYEGLPCPWADKNPICRLGHLCYPRLGGDMALLCHAVGVKSHKGKSRFRPWCRGWEICSPTRLCRY